MSIDIIDTPEKVMKSMTSREAGIAAIIEYSNHHLITTVEDLFLDDDVYKDRVIYSTQGHDHMHKAQLNLIHIKDVLKRNRENTLKIIQKIHYGG